MNKNRPYYCKSRGIYARLPAWADFFIKLGSAVAFAPVPLDHRLVVAVVAPTRLLAAALVGTGVVLERAGLDTESNRYFDYLASLPPGTPLRCREGGRWYPAQFVGVEVCDAISPGKRYIRVQWQSREAGSGSSLIPPNAVENITIAEAIPGRKLPKKLKGHRIDVNKSFLEKWLGLIDPYLFAFQCQLDCVIIGHIPRLDDEITGTRLIFPTATGNVCGTLQDLLRVKRFSKPGEGFRSEIVPTYGRTVPRGPEPAVVVFDGIAGFYKYRDTWPRAHRILVLDRTDHRLHEAVVELRSAYLYRVNSDVPASVYRELKVPAGVELLCFEEVVR